MRDYLPKEYSLPRWIYKIVLETVRGYGDMVQKMKDNTYDVVYSTPGRDYYQDKKSGGSNNTGIRPMAGMEHMPAPLYRSAGKINRPTEDKALKIAATNEEYGRLTKAVEQAMTCMKEDERNIILNNIINDAPLKWMWAKGRSRTLRRKKREFIFMVAENLNLL